MSDAIHFVLQDRGKEPLGPGLRGQPKKDEILQAVTVHVRRLESDGHYRQGDRMAGVPGQGAAGPTAIEGADLYSLLLSTRDGYGERRCLPGLASESNQGPGAPGEGLGLQVAQRLPARCGKNDQLVKLGGEGEELLSSIARYVAQDPVSVARAHPLGFGSGVRGEGAGPVPEQAPKTTPCGIRSEQRAVQVAVPIKIQDARPVRPAVDMALS